MGEEEGAGVARPPQGQQGFPHLDGKHFLKKNKYCTLQPEPRSSKEKEVRHHGQVAADRAERHWATTADTDSHGFNLAHFEQDQERFFIPGRHEQPQRRYNEYVNLNVE